MNKIIKIILLLTLVIGGLYLYKLLKPAQEFYPMNGELAEEKEPEEKETPPQASAANIPVVVATRVYRDIFHDRVEALGSARSNESVEITANITKTISAIKFSDGQQVKKGDVIALLEQSAEQAELKAAQAQLAEHRRELGRLQTLLKNKAASMRDYEERLTLVEVSERRVEQVKARIAELTIKAPFDGVLGIRQVSAGSLVRPGDIITTIDDISSIKLDFNVPSAHLSGLRPGTGVRATARPFGEKLFTGHVETVNTRIDPITRNILVRAIIPNPEGLLRPGLLMQVELLQDEREVLVIAEEATLQMQDKHFVMVIGENGIVEQREIQIGARMPGLIEITGGIAEGELVIVRGLQAARAGQKVAVGEIRGGVEHVNSASGI